MSVYVTVGTTSFDSLIQALDNAEVAAVLKESGYKTLTMQVWLLLLSKACLTSVLRQIGRGSYIPTVLPTVKDFDFSFYTFKPSIQEDMTSADLIISHAGAGSIMESLRIGKPLIVVVNEALMDNHQIELAKAMQGQGYLRFCHVPGLLEVNISAVLAWEYWVYPISCLLVVLYRS